jgi:hypothetical protein
LFARIELQQLSRIAADRRERSFFHGLERSYFSILARPYIPVFQRIEKGNTGPFTASRRKPGKAARRGADRQK